MRANIGYKMGEFVFTKPCDRYVHIKKKKKKKVVVKDNGTSS